MTSNFDRVNPPLGHAALRHLAIALPRGRGTALLTALQERREWRTTRCGTARHLEELLRAGGCDAGVVAEDLLDRDGGLERLTRQRVPIILLTDRHIETRDAGVVAIAWESATVEAIEAAIGAASGGRARRGARGGRAARPQAAGGAAGGAGDRAGGLPAPVAANGHAGADAAGESSEGGRRGNVIVVAGSGAPGRSTVALGIAVALGLRWRTVLVDADVANPTLAAYCNADPGRNLYLLSYAAREAGADWDEALAGQLQPLHPLVRHGQLLGGLPQPWTRARVPRDFVGDALEALAVRHRWVVVDIGADPRGDADIHAAALAAAGHVILVGMPDAPGIRRLREAREGFGETGLPEERIAIVINHWNRRVHHGWRQISLAAEAALLAVIPEDAGHAQRAVVRQEPLALDRGSAAGRALLQLGARIGETAERRGQPGRAGEVRSRGEPLVRRSGGWLPWRRPRRRAV